MILATVGWSSTRERIAAGSIRRWPGSAAQVLEQDRLDILEMDAPGWRQQRPDLTAPDKAPAPELDALQPTGTRPTADR